MKKILSILFASIMLVSVFAGCNTAKNAGSTVSQAASDAMSGAGEVVEDIGNGVATAPDAAESDVSGMIENGKIDSTEQTTDGMEETAPSTYVDELTSGDELL